MESKQIGFLFVIAVGVANLYSCSDAARDTSSPGVIQPTPTPPPQSLSRVAPLNDTGLMGCYADSGPSLPCPNTSFPGQDGDTGLDAASTDNSDGIAGFKFTKLDAGGNTLPLSATQWSCVLDNVTGFVWENKEQLPGSLRSASNTYSWYSSDSTNNSGEPGTLNGGTCAVGRCDTEGYVNAINAAKLCGRTGWRMPERDELNSVIRIVTNNLDSPLDPNFFPYHGIGDYWVGTSPGWSTSIGVSGGAANYLALLAYGFLPKANTMRVILVNGAKRPWTGNVTAKFDQICRTDTVRAATPNTRFTDNLNGTVTDKETGISWTRCPLGRTWDQATQVCAGAATSATWQGALQAAAEINTVGGIGGHADWRLPNYKELISIAEPQCVSPAINLEIFPLWNADGIYVFWSSTTVAQSPTQAFRMGFGGASFLDSLAKTNSQNMLLVRGPSL